MAIADRPGGRFQHAHIYCTFMPHHDHSHRTSPPGTAPRGAGPPSAAPRTELAVEASMVEHGPLKIWHDRPVLNTERVKRTEAKPSRLCST